MDSSNSLTNSTFQWYLDDFVILPYNQEYEVKKFFDTINIIDSYEA